MTSADYKDAFRMAKEEYSLLSEQRASIEQQLKEIDQRMVHVRRGVIALAALAGEEIDEVGLGLTESIRALLKDSLVPLTTQQVMDGIAGLGFDLSTQKNPAASIIAVLNRLHGGKEIRRQTKHDKGLGGTIRTKVFWLGPNVPLEADPK